MNKLFLFGGIAAMALSVASCSSELDQPGSADGNVHFRVQLPAQMRTRAFADGKTASTLTYAVYESGTKNLVTQGVDAYTFDPETLTADVTLQLVNGKKYDIVFWADAPGQNFYKFEPSTQEVTVSYTSLSGNDETRDAFFKCQTFDVTGPINETVELRRPFAQVNLGTDDLQTDAVKQAYADGLKAALSTTAYSTLNLVNGQVSNPTAVSFAAAPAADCTSQPFPYNPNAGTATPNPYEYIAMDYILVDAAKDVIDLTYTFYNGTTANQQPLTVSNVPVQRNYRTNIYGSVLTSPANLKVEVIPAFAGDDYNVSVIDASTPAEFAKALATAKDGDVINLAADMTFAESGIQTIDKDITINVPAGTTVTTARQVNTANFVIAEGANVTLTGNGTFSADNRIFDINGTLTVDGPDFTTTTKTRGSALTVNQGGTLNLNSGTVTVANCGVWVEGDFNMNGGTVKSLNSSSDPEVGGGFSYAVRAITSSANIVINGGEVEGIQGAVGAYAGNITINGGYFHTHPKFGTSDNFYALYVADGEGYAIVNGGYFYAEGRPDVYLVDNHGSIQLKGGFYEDQGRQVTGNDSEQTTIHGICQPASGYEWVADKGISPWGSPYNWAIKPIAENP